MKLSLYSASAILCCTLPGCDFFSTSQTPLPYLYHQIWQDFRISFPFMVLDAMGDHLPSSNRMWIICLLESKVCKARRLAAFICGLFLSWFHISHSACLVRCSPTDLEASVVNSMSRESWATGQLLHSHRFSTHQRISVSACPFVRKNCDCNPLMKSAELYLHSVITLPLADDCRCCWML